MAELQNIRDGNYKYGPYEIFYVIPTGDYAVLNDRGFLVIKHCKTVDEAVKMIDGLEVKSDGN